MANQASPTLSTSSTLLSSTTTRATAPTTTASSSSKIVVPSREELKLQAHRAVQKTRIVTDPSLSSAFRKDVDPELYELFVGP
ncbi:hypothetical protein JCM3766R1_002387 [Sporobolomyces carnicolor]